MKKTFIYLFPYLSMTVAIGFFAGRLLQWPDLDQWLLFSANLLLFITGWMILAMQKSALEGGNPHAFVRSVMGGISLKMVIFLIAVILYAVSFRPDLNKGLISGAILLYLTYLVLEVAYLMKLNKK